MKVTKYIIYYQIGNEVEVLLDDNELPSVELNENVTVDTADQILDNIYFSELFKYHSELSELDQTDELSIIEYCLVGSVKLNKGEFRNIYDVEKDNQVSERLKGWIQHSSQKI